MKLTLLRTTMVAGLLFGISSGSLLADNVKKIVHEVGAVTRRFISEELKSPKTQQFLLTFLKKGLQEGRDTIKEVRILVEGLVQLIEKGGPVADTIIGKISDEQQKEKATQMANTIKLKEAYLKANRAAAADKLKLKETDLKIEQEKQKTLRQQAKLNYERDITWSGAGIRGLKAVAWPAVVLSLGSFAIWKIGIPIVAWKTGIPIVAIMKLPKLKPKLK